MGIQVVMSAEMMCTFGLAPSTLIVEPEGPPVTVGGLPAATIMSHVPIANIPPFGMCQSLANPEVATATTAALGVLTPMPCVPVTSAPWAPGSPTVTINGSPALSSDDMCICDWGGEISITDPGQATTEIAG